MSCPLDLQVGSGAVVSSSHIEEHPGGKVWRGTIRLRLAGPKGAVCEVPFRRRRRHCRCARRCRRTRTPCIP